MKNEITPEVKIHTDLETAPMEVKEKFKTLKEKFPDLVFVRAGVSVSGNSAGVYLELFDLSRKHKDATFYNEFTMFGMLIGISTKTTLTKNN